MKKSLKIAVLIAIAMVMFALVFTWIKPQNIAKYKTRYQHEIEKDADSSIGTADIPDDFKIDESFTTHLPIVIIDLHGNRMPNVYRFTTDGKGKTYTEEGLINPNPWAEMTISIIDNEKNVNCLSDNPIIVNDGLIKLRGMTSKSYENY